MFENQAALSGVELRRVDALGNRDEVDALMAQSEDGGDRGSEDSQTSDDDVGTEDTTLPPGTNPDDPREPE